MTVEVGNMILKGVIHKVGHQQGEYISNIFSRPKPDGRYRIILNLARIKENIVYQHFKMTSLNTALEMVSPGCWLASVDLKDTYYLLGWETL